MLRSLPNALTVLRMASAPAGAVQIRDVRAWHGGTPNVSDDVRAIPNVEYYAPWFREPTIPGITEADWRTLSEHGQQLTRHLVQLPSEELRTGWSFRPLGPFRAR